MQEDILFSSLTKEILSASRVIGAHVSWLVPGSWPSCLASGVFWDNSGAAFQRHSVVFSLSPLLVKMLAGVLLAARFERGLMYFCGPPSVRETHTHGIRILLLWAAQRNQPGQPRPAAHKADTALPARSARLPAGLALWGWASIRTEGSAEFKSTVRGKHGRTYVTQHFLT